MPEERRPNTAGGAPTSPRPIACSGGETRAVIVMGVTACGKSSVGRCIAALAGSQWQFIDGDSLHPARNIDKMSRGIALDDADRAPWLARIVATARKLIDTRDNDSPSGDAPGLDRCATGIVIACSALKRQYRDQLRAIGPGTRFVHLVGTKAEIAARMQAREDHFMAPSLLDSQFATLEGTDEESDVLRLDVNESIDTLAATAVSLLGLRTDSATAANSTMTAEAPSRT
ncbi:MAG: hypothetical protein CSB44_10065 [Gammaproteobacteria bacterium]|nr:MAG: hypothetical protein CSB44_10065 [Gammaproteobacteria bacterium]